MIVYIVSLMNDTAATAPTGLVCESWELGQTNLNHHDGATTATGLVLALDHLQRRLDKIGEGLFVLQDRNVFKDELVVLYGCLRYPLKTGLHSNKVLLAAKIIIVSHHPYRLLHCKPSDPRASVICYVRFSNSFDQLAHKRWTVSKHDCNIKICCRLQFAQLYNKAKIGLQVRSLCLVCSVNYLQIKGASMLSVRARALQVTVN